MQFLTFVPHREQTLVKKDSPSSRTTKSSFFSSSANFGNVSPFLVAATNTFSQLIHPLIKLPNCVLKQQLHILQFIRSARLFQLSPSSRSRHRFCWRTATSTHFWSSTIYRYTTFHREATLKTALELLDYSVMIRRQVQKITRVFSLEIKSKRAELWTDFWQLINIFEPPGQNELIVWKTDSHFFFSCLTCCMGVWSSHPSRA